MSLILWMGTCIATKLRCAPIPKSKKKRLPFPSSTIMQVPACDRVGGTGVLPINEIRISSGPNSSMPGKKLLAFFTDAVGR